MPDVQLGFVGINEVINVHPIFVHFPVGLLLAAVVFYILGSLFKNESLLAAGKWNLFAGALTAGFAVWTGLGAKAAVPHAGSIHEVMELHEKLGFVILAVSVLLSVWVLLSRANIPSKAKGLFFAGLVILGLAIAQTADLGGRMVFLNGVGVGRKSMMPAESAGHQGGGHDQHAHEH